MPALELPENLFRLADGASLSFVEYGFGQTTLLVHGSLCDYRYWRWQIAALGEYGRVIAPSLRGYWPNAPLAPFANNAFSVRQHATDLLELVHATDPGQAVNVIGHSRGAHVAMEMALQAPDTVKALVLADPGMNLEGVDHNREFLLQAASAIAQGHEEDGLATFIDAVSGADTWRRMTGWFKTMVRDNAPTLLSQAHEADTSYSPQLFSAIRCPVLLLGGQQSPPRYRQIMDVLQDHIGHASRDTIALASHGMNLANPKSFNRKVLEFLNG